MDKRDKRLISAMTSQRGMTLIEIMIVLGIIAVVMGFLVGPRVFRMFADSKVKTTDLQAMQFVEAHTEWSMNNDDNCPGSLDDLTKYMNSKETDDAWGKPLIMVCGDDAPEGVQFGVQSRGEDGKKGTKDDVKSWERAKKKKKKD